MARRAVRTVNETRCRGCGRIRLASVNPLQPAVSALPPRSCAAITRRYRVPRNSWLDTGAHRTQGRICAILRFDQIVQHSQNKASLRHHLPIEVGRQGNPWDTTCGGQVHGASEDWLWELGTSSRFANNASLRISTSHVRAHRLSAPHARCANGVSPLLTLSSRFSTSSTFSTGFSRLESCMHGAGGTSGQRPVRIAPAPSYFAG